MLTFDLREEAEPDPLTVSKLVEKYDVIISIKPKPKLSVKSVNIRGYERNAGNFLVLKTARSGIVYLNYFNQVIFMKHVA